MKGDTDVEGPRGDERTMAMTKGTNLIDMVKYLRKQKQRAREALPARLHEYLETQIVITDWYPERDMYELMQALEKLLPITGPDLYREVGVLNAHNHLRGSYRHLLKDMHLRALPVRAEALWKSLHDTGQLVIRVEDDSSGRVLLRDYANPGPDMCLVIESYMAEVFRLIGIESVQTAVESCVHHGGTECRWHFQGA